MSPSTWAMACSPISAGRRRMRTTPSGRSGPGSRSSKRWRGWRRLRASRSRRRVGIATGLVMVGELIGEGAAQEQAVVGETPNLAARLQALADPGSVVIGQATRRLVGGLFELTDLGPTAPQGLRRAARGLPGRGRGSRRRAASRRGRPHLTPLVGREEEIALLLRALAAGQDGEGQVVLLSGEPGIGKSRLVRDAARAARRTSRTSPAQPMLAPPHDQSALSDDRAAGACGGFCDRTTRAEAKIGKLEALLPRGTDGLSRRCR